MEERAGCLAFIVFPMSCYCKCSVTLPHLPWVGLQILIVVFPDHTQTGNETLKTTTKLDVILLAESQQ